MDLSSSTTSNHLHEGWAAMRLEPASRIHSGIPRLILATLVLLALPISNATAEDLLGLYVGGAIGQSRVEATDVGFLKPEFAENHSAFKAMVGIRPISLLGAELDYIDFGNASGSLRFPSNVANTGTAAVSVKGEAAFGLIYLPIPIVDVYAKAGLSRLQTSVNGGDNFYQCGVPPGPPGCPFVSHFQLSRTDTGFAAGAGAQYKFGSWAVRAEYERFDAAGAHPSLVSAGIAWTFF
jgi:opacity protein-like surface antigen